MGPPAGARGEDFCSLVGPPLARHSIAARGQLPYPCWDEPLPAMLGTSHSDGRDVLARRRRAFVKGDCIVTLYGARRGCSKSMGSQRIPLGPGCGGGKDEQGSLCRTPRGLAAHEARLSSP